MHKQKQVAAWVPPPVAIEVRFSSPRDGDWSCYVKQDVTWKQISCCTSLTIPSHAKVGDVVTFAHVLNACFKFFSAPAYICLADKGKNVNNEHNTFSDLKGNILHIKPPSLFASVSGAQVLGWCESSTCWTIIPTKTNLPQFELIRKRTLDQNQTTWQTGIPSHGHAQQQKNMAFGRNTMSIHNCLSPCLPQQVALTIRLCFGDVHCSKKTPGEPQLCFFWRMAHVATLSSPCLILISLLYHKMLHHIFPPPHHPRTAAVSPFGTT